MTNQEQLDAAREFSRRVIQASWDARDVNAGDIQDWARELGLIFSRKASADDAQEFSEIEKGDDMYEFEAWMQYVGPIMRHTISGSDAAEDDDL